MRYNFSCARQRCARRVPCNALPHDRADHQDDDQRRVKHRDRRAEKEEFYDLSDRFGKYHREVRRMGVVVDGNVGPLPYLLIGNIITQIIIGGPRLTLFLVHLQTGDMKFGVGNDLLKHTVRGVDYRPGKNDPCDNKRDIAEVGISADGVEDRRGGIEPERRRQQRQRHHSNPDEHQKPLVFPEQPVDVAHAGEHTVFRLVLFFCFFFGHIFITSCT